MGRSRGLSLIELLVVMGLMGIVTIGVGVLISKGVDFYLDSTDGIEVRKELMYGATRLSKDLADSFIDVVQPEANGLVFPTVRSPQGQVVTDNSGRVLWQSYLCYSYDPATDRLTRYESDLPRHASGDPHPLNPPDDRGETRPPDPLGESPPYDRAWFISTPGLSQRVAARNVKSFTAQKNVDLIEFTIEVSVSTRREHMVSLNTKVKPGDF